MVEERKMDRIGWENARRSGDGRWAGAVADGLVVGRFLVLSADRDVGWDCVSPSGSVPYPGSIPCVVQDTTGQLRMPSRGRLSKLSCDQGTTTSRQTINQYVIIAYCLSEKLLCKGGGINIARSRVDPVGTDLTWERQLS
jgi:hypothetical protein